MKICWIFLIDRPKEKSNGMTGYKLPVYVFPVICFLIIRIVMMDSEPYICSLFAFSNSTICLYLASLVHSVLTWLSNKTDGWTVTRPSPGEPWPPRVRACVCVCEYGPSVWAVKRLSLFALLFWPTSSTVNTESTQAHGSVSLFLCVCACVYECQYIQGWVLGGQTDTHTLFFMISSMDCEYSINDGWAAPGHYLLNQICDIWYGFNLKSICNAI